MTTKRLKYGQPKTFWCLKFKSGNIDLMDGEYGDYDLTLFASRKNALLAANDFEKKPTPVKIKISLVK